MARGSASVRVRQVTTRRDLRRFVGVQWRIYGSTGVWVPPLVAERMQKLSARRNPFFAHS